MTIIFGNTMHCIHSQIGSWMVMMLHLKLIKVTQSQIWEMWDFGLTCDVKPIEMYQPSAPSYIRKQKDAIINYSPWTALHITDDLKVYICHTFYYMYVFMLRKLPIGKTLQIYMTWEGHNTYMWPLIAL